MATIDEFAVGERVALDMSGFFGRSRRDWRDLSEYERVAWLIFEEFSQAGLIWEE